MKGIQLMFLILPLIACSQDVIRGYVFQDTLAQEDVNIYNKTLFK